LRYPDLLMKKAYLILAVLALFAASFVIGHLGGPVEAGQMSAPLVSPNLVISQFYGGGGNSGAVFTHDFVEIFNRGDSPVDLDGWSTQYASATGSEFFVTTLSDIVLQPGQYYLIQYASNGSNGSPLPTPDRIAPPITNNAGNTFVPNLSGSTGKLALVNSTERLPASNCPVSGSIADFVGYGDNASCFEGAKTANLSVTTAGKRSGNGCTDTDNNAADFMIGPPAPRNTDTVPAICDLGSSLQAGISANPNTVSPNSSILFTVSVFPATTPPSTDISVTADLSSLGGPTSQAFFDNGTNGDVTPGDNVYSYVYAVPGNTDGGTFSVAAVVADAQARTADVSVTITVNAPLPGEAPLLFGNPSFATPVIADENNYLMIKPQYTLSYNRANATANWVAWRLDSTWIGNSGRQDDFRPDTTLPSGWYQVRDFDYSGSGYDRGHMVPSGDRTRTIADNSATFLMTNIVPQLAANNQGPWNDFENYLRSLATAGQEIYIISGPTGNIGTISAGKIVVPEYTWKVVLILQNGNNDLQRASREARAFGIVVPNFAPISTNAWRNYRFTVDYVEYLTGHDFFSEIPKNTQELIERKRDKL
jgi:endonuclease G, mitochondrial